MKKKILSLLVLISVTTYAQVGIGTTSPTAQLDVKGDLKVRTTILNNTLVSAKDSVLVVNSGVINRVTSKQIYDSHIKSFVKGTGGTTTSLGATIGSTAYKKIAFNTEAFDENLDFDTTTYEFTAPKTGIYSVYVQFELTSLVSLVNVGVAIFTTKGATTTLEAEEEYTSINAVVVKVSPPTRKVQTLLKLNTGDKVFFGATPDSGITLVGGSKSFFTIMQVE
ncbi:MAG: hypothetical protein V4572_02055 [Bacteroidota bacterium]